MNVELTHLVNENDLLVERRLDYGIFCDIMVRAIVNAPTNAPEVQKKYAIHTASDISLVITNSIIGI